MARHGPPVIFRSEDGRFMKHAHRYRPEVAMVQAWRAGRYVDLSYEAVPAKQLADILSHREFETLKEATDPIDEYKSSKKYKAWDIAEQIDRTKGLRRKDMKLTVVVEDKGRRREVAIYHKIKRNTASSYRIFQRINEELGFMGMFLYDRAGGKLLADRKGRKVKLVKVIVEEVL